MKGQEGEDDTGQNERKKGDKWPELKRYVHTYGKRVGIPMTPSSRLWCLGRMIKPLTRREGMSLGGKNVWGHQLLLLCLVPFHQLQEGHSFMTLIQFKFYNSFTWGLLLSSVILQ